MSSAWRPQCGCPPCFPLPWGFNTLSVVLSAGAALLVFALLLLKRPGSAGLAEPQPVDRRALFCVLPLLLLSLSSCIPTRFYPRKTARCTPANRLSAICPCISGLFPPSRTSPSLHIIRFCRKRQSGIRSFANRPLWRFSPWAASRFALMLPSAFALCAVLWGVFLLPPMEKGRQKSRPGVLPVFHRRGFRNLLFSKRLPAKPRELHPDLHGVL